MSRCGKALAAVVCLGVGSCVLPEATEVGPLTDGGAGSAGSGATGGSAGQAGAAACPASSAKWPDSTPHCSDGAEPPCPHATEDGNITGAIPSYSPGSGGSTLIDSLTGLEWEQDASQQGTL